LSLTFSSGSDYAASVSGHVTSHLIATARGRALYAAVAYYTMGIGIHTGLQLQKWLYAEEHVCTNNGELRTCVISLLFTPAMSWSRNKCLTLRSLRENLLSSLLIILHS